MTSQRRRRVMYQIVDYYADAICIDPYVVRLKLSHPIIIVIANANEFDQTIVVAGDPSSSLSIELTRRSWL